MTLQGLLLYCDWLPQGVAMRLHDITMQIILNPQLGGYIGSHLTTNLLQVICFKIQGEGAKMLRIHYYYFCVTPWKESINKGWQNHFSLRANIPESHGPILGKSTKIALTDQAVFDI